MALRSLPLPATMKAPAEATTDGLAMTNFGLTTSEASRRLWEELTPVPTRKNSIRFITTYAGYEGESQLLRGLYLRGVDSSEHPEGQGRRIDAALPLYEDG